MIISKTTVNFASRRNIEIVTSEDTVHLYSALDDSEPLIIYHTNADSTLYQFANIQLEYVEDLMYWIQTEKQLRQVIDYISKQL